LSCSQGYSWEAGDHSSARFWDLRAIVQAIVPLCEAQRAQELSQTESRLAGANDNPQALKPRGNPDMLWKLKAALRNTLNEGGLRWARR